MALRISVDLDDLRWADLFRFVDLARNCGIGADDPVDVITYGNDPLSVSLSARIYPPADAFGPGEPELGGEPAGRSNVPAIGAAQPSSNGSSFGYDPPADERGPGGNGAHYPSFETPSERPGPGGPPNLPSFSGGYDGQGERGGAPPTAVATHYPSFDGQGERLGPGGAGGQFAGFEPVFDRQAGAIQGGIKEPVPGGPGVPGQVDSPYVEEFARLQEGLMRQVRRPDEVRPERG
ncbi:MULTISPECIES: hypothetical protein [Protofrankia]|uniref:Uncharacterized protein n=1 Tax=Candidatus Protofrankia datiscae TaxID=2716812 RepID=F8B157_9ACTN|nr:MULTISPECIES: hypothetical protein [Protofrankia]AEH08793.1 hypothetical protein FsymDg_1311 [Candidatus Protofrankia datiscae]